MRHTLIFFLIALSAAAQTNSGFPTNQSATSSNAAQAQAEMKESFAKAQRIEQIRTACIEQRRRISGKILKILPDGLVVESGYTNLSRYPLDRQWLVPGTAVADRATNAIEGTQAGTVCIGLVFLTDLPRSPGVKPRVYDYVNLEAFPAGNYTYVSVGDVRRTVRRFSSKLPKAVEWNFDESEKEKTRPK
jgi:hypothetical protein